MKKRMKQLAILFVVLIFSLVGCSSNKDSITIAAITSTETKVLAHIYKQLIEEKTDLQVTLKEDLAASPVVLEGMQNGDIDVSTQYTGTAIASYFEIENPHDPDATFEQARELFSEEPFNFKFFDRLGFANTYAFTVKREIAEQYNLEKVSDLEGIAQEFRAGFDTAWLERENDGYPAFKQTYDIEFKETHPMEINLVYDAVKNGEVDIVLAYTTDPRIVAYDLVMLEDDRKFFPPYDALYAVREETLEKYPEIEDALSPLIGLIDEATMGELNGRIDLDGEDFETVAREFLQSEGLIE